MCLLVLTEKTILLKICLMNAAVVKKTLQCCKTVMPGDVGKQ